MTYGFVAPFILLSTSYPLSKIALREVLRGKCKHCTTTLPGVFRGNVNTAVLLYTKFLGICKHCSLTLHIVLRGNVNTPVLLYTEFLGEM